MKKLIEDFPQNIKDAIQIGNAHHFTKPTREIKNIIICGSCKSECHDNTVCILVEFTKELNKLFICGCNHNENDGDKAQDN